MKTNALALLCAALLWLMPALAAAQNRPSGGGTTVGSAEPRGGGSTSGSASSPSSSGGSSGGNSVSSAGGSAMPSSPVNMGSARYDGPRSGEAGMARGRNASPSVGQPVPASERPRGDRPAYGQAITRAEAAAAKPRVTNVNGYSYNPFSDGYWGYSDTYYFRTWTSGSMYMSGFPYWWYDPWSGLGPLYGYGMYALPLSRYGSLWYDYYAGAAGAAYVDSAQGSLKLKVTPKNAEVYVDGSFYGTVDHYNGVFQHLDLRSGTHSLEIRLNGYETLTFQVRVLPGRSITYSGQLKAVK